MAQLEWLSNFFDDTTDNFSLDFPGSLANPGGSSADLGNLISSNSSSSNGKEDSPFRTPSPVSVLETTSLSAAGSGGSSGGSASSSSSSSSSTSSYSAGGGGSSAQALAAPPEPVPAFPARARSKRPRPATFSPRPHVTLPFLPPSSGPAHPQPPSEPEAFAESASPMKNKKEKKAAFADDGEGACAPPHHPAVRKCMHCEIQKTPQWRAGPMGPKTLCNACGVRYKSGRLFPEYRPAASPTFCPTAHSNSHKKVVEMRIKATQEAQVDGCDLLEYIRRRD